MAKLDLRGFYKAHKKGVLGVIALALVISMGLGIWYYAANTSSEPVYVYPFQYIGMTEYWGDSQESYGPVSSDNIQTVFLSDTQTVTEILVKEGDEVAKGDLLMSFDTTLDDLKLERKRLEVEKQKLELEAAKNRLMDIRNMVPMQIIQFAPDEGFYDESLGEVVSGFRVYGDRLTNPENFQNALNYDGSSEVTPLILWLEDGYSFTGDIAEVLRRVAGELQWQNQENAKPEEEPEDTPPETPPETPDDGNTETPGGETQDPTGESSQDGSEGGNTPPPPSDDTQTPPPDESAGTEGGTGEASDADTDVDSGSGGIGCNPVSNYYVVIRVTAGDQMYAAKETWTGLYVIGSGIRFFEPVISDPFMEGYDSDSGFAGPGVNMGSGYTAAQIAEMRREQEKKIKELEFQVRLVEADYKLMEKEFNDGNVYAEVDGTVVSLLTEEEAKSSRQPVIKVSGGGGYYIEGFVNELEKEKMEVGLPVTVNDWNNGMTYEAEVSSIGDFPSQEGYYNGMGNPNASYYPFRVFVDGSADLRTGSYVSVMYSTSGSESGIYLENPFLRTENGSTYVLALGADGKLEQRYVTTGKSLWGNYTEIRSGITAEDLIAFPYGKHVKPGVPAIEGDMSNLYE